MLWRLLLHFQINVAVSQSQMRAEIEAIKRRLDYQRNTTMRRASDAQMYVNSPTISLLHQWCRAIGLCHNVEVC